LPRLAHGGGVCISHGMGADTGPGHGAEGCVGRDGEARQVVSQKEVAREAQR
jgi:hypothetical protein